MEYETAGALADYGLEIAAILIGAYMGRRVAKRVIDFERVAKSKRKLNDLIEKEFQKNFWNI